MVRKSKVQCGPAVPNPSTHPISKPTGVTCQSAEKSSPTPKPLPAHALQRAPEARHSSVFLKSRSGGKAAKPEHPLVPPRDPDASNNSCHCKYWVYCSSLLAPWAHLSLQRRKPRKLQPNKLPNPFGNTGYLPWSRIDASPERP